MWNVKSAVWIPAKIFFELSLINSSKYGERQICVQQGGGFAIHKNATSNVNRKIMEVKT